MCDDHDAAARAASDRTRRTRPGSTQGSYGRSHRERFRAGVLLRDNSCRCDQQCPDHGAGQPCMNLPDTADHWPRSKAELAAAGLDVDDPTYGRALCKGCHDRRQGEGPGAHGYRHPPA